MVWREAVGGVQGGRVALDVERLDPAEAAGHGRAGRVGACLPAGQGGADGLSELVQAVAHADGAYRIWGAGAGRPPARPHTSLTISNDRSRTAWSWMWPDTITSSAPVSRTNASSAAATVAGEPTAA